MQLIKVRYVGKGDSILTEHDGVKYNFSKSNPVTIIPLAVYNFMQDYQNPYREYVVPFSDVTEEVKEEKKATIADDIDAIEQSIKKEPTHERKKSRRSGR